MNQTNKLFAAYARLTALKSNLPNHAEVHEKYVQDFHSFVDWLRDLSGFDLESLRIPSSDYRAGESGISGDHYCERQVLTLKIDALLSWFHLQFSPPLHWAQ